MTDTATDIDRPAPIQDTRTGRFLPGNSGGNGRPRGCRNKLGEAFIADLHEAWQANGPEVIENVIKDKPDVMLKVIASILPKEIRVTNPEDDLSDEQMERTLDVLRRIIERRGLTGRRAADIDGTSQEIGPEPAGELPALPETGRVPR